MYRDNVAHINEKIVEGPIRKNELIMKIEVYNTWVKSYIGDYRTEGNVYDLWKYGRKDPHKEDRIDMTFSWREAKLPKSG